MRQIVLTALASVIFGSAACSFDSSGLTERLCGSDAECESGSCVDGVCLFDIVSDGGDVDGGDFDVPPTEDADAADAVETDTDTATDADAASDTETGCGTVGLRCDGAVRVECGADGESVVIEDCDDTEDCGVFGCLCEPETCVPRLCEPNQRRCEGNVPFVCDDSGATIEQGDPCADGTECSAGVCVPLACSPSSASCVDGVLVTCDDGGLVSETFDCEALGDTCVETDAAASCVTPACVPGTRSCESVGTGGGRVVECNLAGTGRDLVETCDDMRVCVLDRCVEQICEPSVASCSDTATLEICDERGLSSAAVSCEEGAVCVAEEADCMPRICTPRLQRCAGALGTEVCSADGTRWEVGPTCAVDQRCFDNACQDTLCAPTTFFCEGNVRSRCSADGLASTVLETCNFGCQPESCAASVCGDAVVDSATEQCDDANSVSCDGCESCSRRSVLVSGAGVATTAGPRYVPREADFTLEGWVNVTSESGSLFGVGYSNEDDYATLRVSEGNPVFIVNLRRGQQVAMRGDARLTGAGWVHIAAVRFNQQTLAIFVNGRMVGIHRGQTTRTGLDGTGRIWVGSDGVQTAATARIDDFRVTAGRKYQVSFAPPRRVIAEAGTVALFAMDEGAGNVLANAAGGPGITVTPAAGWEADDCYDAPAGRIVCGDGVRSPFELCDDGNTVDGDGCSAICTVETRCRTGLERPDAAAGGGCYVRNLTAQNWEDARESCQAWGGDLVTINDAAENDWLAATYGGGVWIGATDSGWDEGTFRWASGQPFSFSAWAAGEPNNGGFGRNEDCSEMIAGGRWNDLRCDDSRFAICEYGD